MKAVHTPGPWVAVKSEAHAGDPDSVRVDIHALGAAYSPAHVASDIMPEDARLIAAAPEMLEALEGVVSWARTYGLDVTPYRTGCSTDQPVIARARAAIARARREVSQ